MNELSVQAQGKWADILNQLGIDRGFLKNSHGPCPVCSGRDRFRFDNKEGKGTYFCSGCGAGDGVSLVMKYLGIPFKDAANEIRKIIDGCSVEPVQKQDEEKERKENLARLKRIHAGLKPIAPGTVAMNYLAGRGLKVLPEKNCYFHEKVPYMGGDRVGAYPAMVSVFRDARNETCTYQINYLNTDGTKLECETPKRHLPKIKPLKGGAVKLFSHDKTLGIAEGVETALACYQIDGYPMWATLSANMVKTVEVPKEVTDVVIYADSDESFTGQSAAFDLACRLKVREGKNVRVVCLVGDKPEMHIETGLNMDMLDYLVLTESEKSN